MQAVEQSDSFSNPNEFSRACQSKKLFKKASKTLLMYSLAELGFSVLCLEFAASTLGYDINKQILACSITLMIICVIAFIQNYNNYKICTCRCTSLVKKNLILNGCAFLLVGLACAFLSTNMVVNFWDLTPLPNWINLITLGLLSLAMIALAISVARIVGMQKNKTKCFVTVSMTPFLLQVAGMVFLLVGALLQTTALSTILPNSGQPLNILKISIASFAAIAGVTALVVSLLACLLIYRVSNIDQNADQQDRHNAETPESLQTSSSRVYQS